jgi:hypothetical protein
MHIHIRIRIRIHIHILRPAPGFVHPPHTGVTRVLSIVPSTDARVPDAIEQARPGTSPTDLDANCTRHPAGQHPHSLALATWQESADEERHPVPVPICSSRAIHTTTAKPTSESVMALVADTLAQSPLPFPQSSWPRGSVIVATCLRVRGQGGPTEAPWRHALRKRGLRSALRQRGA